MKPARLILGTIVVLLFALFVWPSRWKYEQIQIAGPSTVLIRIDRLNGEVWTMERGLGWVHQQSLGSSPLSALVDRLIQEDQEEQARKR